MKLPIGFHKFHKNKFLNYQLNRWYSLGYSELKNTQQISSKIKTFDDYINEFRIASDTAKNEGRLKDAATYLRASEFLVSPNDDRKIPVYKEFIDLFDNAFQDETFERHKIPYNGSFLSAIRIPSKTNETNGTVIGIPGFFKARGYSNPKLETSFFISLLDGVCLNFLADPENYPLSSIKQKIIKQYAE